MRNNKIIIISCLAIFLSCSKEDVTEIKNEKRQPFNLIAISDGAFDIDVKPTFIWEPAIDPEGFNVTYDLLVGKTANNFEPIASTINGTTFTVSNRLPVSEELFWTVKAKDNNGAETLASNTFSFKTRNLTNGTLAVNAFTSLQTHTSLAFDAKLWLIGGQNAVLNSSDGINWNVINANPPFQARMNHSSVTFDSKMWVIGGESSLVNKNDVWFSSNGINWTKAIENAPFSARQGHSSVVFDNNIWVIGGHAGATSFNDVWFSTNGTNWQKATDNVNFTIRKEHTTVVFDNKMYMISGNEVRFSTDGVTWNLASTVNDFSSRSNHSSVVFDGKIWLIGGFGTIDRNDVWFSKDGVTWIRNVESANFNDRSNHTSVVFKDKIWVVGGVKLFSASGADPNNGIWFLD